MKEFEDILEEISHNLEWCDDAYQSRCYRRSHDEIIRLRAALAVVTAERDRMREALKPLAGMDVELLDENKKPTGIHAFDAWHSGQVVFDIGKDRKITVSDLRRARAAIEGVTEPAKGVDLGQ